jgi:hypothetical protein
MHCRKSKHESAVLTLFFSVKGTPATPASATTYRLAVRSDATDYLLHGWKTWGQSRVGGNDMLGLFILIAIVVFLAVEVAILNTLTRGSPRQRWAIARSGWGRDRV